MENSKSTIACDVVNLILGAFLFIAPWLFNYAPGAESWNAWIAGAVIAALSVVALSAFAEWEEWLNLVVGLWVIVSPWVHRGCSACRRRNLADAWRNAARHPNALDARKSKKPRQNGRGFSGFLFAHAPFQSFTPTLSERFSCLVVS